MIPSISNLKTDRIWTNKNSCQDARSSTAIVFAMETLNSHSQLTRSLLYVNGDVFLFFQVEHRSTNFPHDSSCPDVMEIFWLCLLYGHRTDFFGVSGCQEVLMAVPITNLITSTRFCLCRSVVARSKGLSILLLSNVDRSDIKIYAPQLDKDTHAESYWTNSQVS